MTIQWVDKGEWNATRHLVIGGDENIDVLDPGMWDNESGPLDWWAVTDDDGIFAYASSVEEAEQIAAHFQKTAVRETMEQHIQRN